MNFASHLPRSLNSVLAVSTTALLLSACGGGGGGAATGGGSTDLVSSVSSASTGMPMYSQKLTLTVNGANVDRLAVTATGCTDVALSTSGSFVSNASTSYYQCTVSSVGAAQFVLKRPTDGFTLGTVTFNVPMPQVTMAFSNGAGVSGNVVVTLAPDKTPITVDNFLKYVNAGFYKDTRIHRVVPGAIIQGGGYGEAISGNATTANIPRIKPTAANIALEVNKGLLNKQWTIAMARADEPNTGNSQFYFNLADNPSLDPTGATAATAGYAVFGSITAGTNIAGAIANPASAPCVSITFFTAAPECTPIPNVVLTSATQTQ
jgi:cyclophilin family peptidyl-prolyl cis-trans isomerase